MLWSGVLFALLIGVAAAWYFGSAGAPGPGPSAPTAPPAASESPASSGPRIVYEEGPSLLPPLEERINDELFAALCQAGVKAEDTHLSVAAEPWGEVTYLRAPLPPEGVEGLRGALAAVLQPLGAKLHWKANGSGGQLELRVDGRLTHRVSFFQPSGGKPQPPPWTKPGKCKVALVMDDMGYQMEPARELVALGMPMTFSILPQSPHGREIGELARRSNIEVLLHLPMEPRSYPRLDPGPGKLLLAMNQDELIRRTRDNLASVPGAVGANNHMGSRFSENSEALRPVLDVLRQSGLFFIDSLTSADSQVEGVAATLGLPYGRRGLFLDHTVSEEAIERQMKLLLGKCRSGESLIVIGHPHPATIRVLRRYAPQLMRAANLVHASRMVRVLGESKAP